MKNIEYFFLDRLASVQAMEQFCNMAKTNNATSVTVPPLFIKKVKADLEGSGIKISTVIGFPYGWSAVEAKVAETILALVDGADELEIVINITALINNDWQYLAKELNSLLTIIRKQQKQVCFILQANVISGEALTNCCDLYGIAGVDCISLSDGLQQELPSVAIVKFVRSHLADSVSIKIAAHQLNDELAELYKDAGANRIATGVK